VYTIRNEEFSSNDIPLDEFGTGIDGDGKTKSNLFIIIPDDDDTFNFVPGMVYTLLFQELYRQARFFGGKLPMDVGFWLDEMANIKMPNNFDKILATCRSRGVYCVPILQSLAQLKTLFADGAWEGIVGNCDTFIYLGGNEASTYEYVSKLLGKWTIDKRTSGESKGSSGSYSENYDVLGRELMLEYELRLLPDDECIIFVRGENPIRDKKWFPWEHEEYLEARKCGAFRPSAQKEAQAKQMEQCQFLSAESVEYLKKQQDKNENIQMYEMDAYAFMMMDLDGLEKKIHSIPNDKKRQGEEITITAGMIESALAMEKKQREEEKNAWFVENFDRLTLLDIYASDRIGEVRRNVIRDLLQAEAEEEVIKSIIRPELEEGQVLQKKAMWLEMKGR
jgi:type IV secretion system protein VirD4